MVMRLLQLVLLISTLIYLVPVSQADMLASATVTDTPLCRSEHQSIVMTGKQVPALIGLSVQRMALYRWSGRRLQPIVFQIDRRDENDRYILADDAVAPADSPQVIFDRNDELVFVQGDAGQRMPVQGDVGNQGQLIEIQISDPEQQVQRWVYVRVFDSLIKTSGKRYIDYFQDSDSVSTGLYQLGFASQAPFLVDRFNWWDRQGKQWSPDLLDTMKIRHNGKLFGMIDFNRTNEDYSSVLVAIKQGPIRIIRRTENRVRVLLGLKTPALYIDYVMAPDGFVMDTMIDIPFTMGMFFSNIETLTTVDWSSAHGLPSMLIKHEQLKEIMPVDGNMSAEKKSFNKIGGKSFGIESQLGVMQVRLDMPDDFPIDTLLYLRDAQHEPDPPESIAGQFGNIGFRTTGWENIDSEVHHLRFRVCLYRKD